MLNHVQLLATPLTLACQTPLRDFPGKNTQVDCHSLLQGIFSIQGSNLSLLNLLYWQADPYHRATWEAHVYVYTNIYNTKEIYIYAYNKFCSNYVSQACVF